MLLMLLFSQVAFTKKDYTKNGPDPLHPNPHQHTPTPVNPSNPVGGGFHRGNQEPLK